MIYLILSGLLIMFVAICNVFNRDIFNKFMENVTRFLIFSLFDMHGNLLHSLCVSCYAFPGCIVTRCQTLQCLALHRVSATALYYTEDL